MIEYKVYKQKELRELLHISDNTWREKRDEIFEYLNEFFDYEVISKGRAIYIDIHSQYKEYEPIPKKSEVARKYYKEKTKEELTDQPWNTGANIARNIIRKGQNKFDHREGTICNYVRPILKNAIVSGKQWMQSDKENYTYVPLTEEEQKYLNALFHGKVDPNEDYDSLQEYKAGYITRKEVGEEVLNRVEIRYDMVMEKFKRKFGFIPIYVKHFEIYDF